MPMSSPPTTAELEAARDEIVASFNALIAAGGGSDLCTAVSATISVLGTKRDELIQFWNDNCGTPADPIEP
jgi:hypothetical protein